MTNLEPLAIHQNNRTWWNETATWYGERDADDDVAVLKAGGHFFMEPVVNLLGDLRPWCGRAIHLQCSHGRDGLSLLNLGAAEVVGVDISDRLIAVARYKSNALGANATWIRSDILETPHDLDDGTADLVFTGNGALCWMMDLDAWAAVTTRLLRPGGRLFIFEGHPLDWVWDNTLPEYRLDDETGGYFSQRHQSRLFGAKTESSPDYRQWTLATVV